MMAHLAVRSGGRRRDGVTAGVDDTTRMKKGRVARPRQPRRYGGCSTEEEGMRDELSIEEQGLATRPMAELNDIELERLGWACLRMSQVAPRVSLRRWRWRRMWSRAFSLLSERSRARMGDGPALCERCRETSPTVHIVYGKGHEERYGHFCAACASLEPPGRMVVSSFSSASVDRAS